jgi:hypothetical protein
VCLGSPARGLGASGLDLGVRSGELLRPVGSLGFTLLGRMFRLGRCDERSEFPRVSVRPACVGIVFGYGEVCRIGRRGLIGIVADDGISWVVS